MRESIEYISSKAGIENRQLIEKDILLHKILVDLCNDRYFSSSFAFKGGTCLIKCYLGYYRFSEDLDFSYVNQKEFEGKSQKEIRKLISTKINSLTHLLSKIAKDNDFEFK